MKRTTTNKKQSRSLIYLVMLFTLVLILSSLVSADHPKPYINEPISIKVVKAEITPSQDKIIDSELTPIVKDNIFRALYEWITNLFSKAAFKDNSEIKERNVTEKNNEEVITIPHQKDTEEGIVTDKKITKAITVPYQRDPAPKWVLEKTKGYITFYVDEDYFEEHISLKQSWTEETIDKIVAKYRVVYDYKFKVKDELDETHFQFSLFLDENGDLVSYKGIKFRGPQRPYQFKINRSEAIAIAQQAGLPGPYVKTLFEIRPGKAVKKENITRNITADIIFALGFNADNAGINESYVWHITAGKIVGGKPEVIYVDVDTGEVVGILTMPDVKLTLSVLNPVELSEGQRSFVEDIIRKEDPTLLDNVSFYMAEKIFDEPNQLKLRYLAQDTRPGSYSPIIIVDLKTKKIFKLRGKTEVTIKDPVTGKTRRADAAGIDSATGKIVEVHQVGKTNVRGDPVSRERGAISDIQSATSRGAVGQKGTEKYSFSDKVKILFNKYTKRGNK